jgi:hypothetical protein
MTTQTQTRPPAVQVARGGAALGFIVTRWLVAICNIPDLCPPLANLSSVTAALYVAMLLGSLERRSSVLGRPGGRLLAVTCVLNLVAHGLSATAPQLFWRQTAIVEALNLAAWIWLLWAALAAARWLWGGAPHAAGTATPRVAPHRVALSGLIAVALGLQVWAFLRPGPTLWPFVDYSLYTSAHGPPIQAVHYRVRGTTAGADSVEIEITANDLGMSWFPYHTQFIPRLFDTPALVLEEFQQRLHDSDLPLFQLVFAEKEMHELLDSELETAVERRAVPLDPVSE